MKDDKQNDRQRAAPTDAQRRAAAKAMVEVFLGFPAPDREPGDLDLRAVDAVVSTLAAPAPVASPAALTDEQIFAIALAAGGSMGAHWGEWKIHGQDLIAFARALLAAQPAEPADLLEAQHNGAKVGEQVGYARGYADGVKADRQGVALSEREAYAVDDQLFSITTQISKEAILDAVVDCLSFDEIISLIKDLDNRCEDWGVTETLYEYFSSEMDKLTEDE